MPISQWLESTDLFTALRESQLAYPIVMATHLACIAVFGGLILMTNMRLLGLALTRYPVPELLRQLRIWKRLGFLVMVTCGALLAGAKAGTYALNPYFWTKLGLLCLVAIHGMAFRRSVYAASIDPETSEAGLARMKLAGWLSLILWIALVCMGRLIAYYEPPKP